MYVYSGGFPTAPCYAYVFARPPAMTLETWEWCLHITTSPIARVVGKVGDGIIDRGLGPLGNFSLLQDFWDSSALYFYKEGLQTFCVEDEWEDGDRVVKWASRWVSRQVEPGDGRTWRAPSRSYHLRSPPPPPYVRFTVAFTFRMEFWSFRNPPPPRGPWDFSVQTRSVNAHTRAGEPPLRMEV